MSFKTEILLLSYSFSINFLFLPVSRKAVLSFTVRRTKQILTLTSCAESTEKVHFNFVYYIEKNFEK